MPTPTPTPTPILSDNKTMAEPDDLQAVPMMVWLRDLDADVLRSRYQNQDDHGIPAAIFENGLLDDDEIPFTPVHQILLRREVCGEELGRNTYTTYDFQRNLQPSRYEQTLRETAPTSNTNLEIQLQRVYGIYNTWSHEQVMEWWIEETGSCNYHIDGPLLATLDVHSLKEKCGDEDFRLRAKFIQAVEFLKDSSQSLRNVSAGNDVNDDSLPQYERSADQ
ncbi:hypothetical protein HDU76_011036 [Blyttiomyces sp. JEL0837]|nr:hypothetical protein HDU76_011036 [Blyttiomyces sp. JEL0837]